VVCLRNEFIEKLTGRYCFIGADWNTIAFCAFQGAIEGFIERGLNVRKAQLPGFIGFYGAHKRVGDGNGDIEIRYGIFVMFASNKVFDIRMIHSQDAHISTAACASLGNFAKGVIVHFEKADWTGGLTR